VRLDSTGPILYSCLVGTRTVLTGQLLAVVFSCTLFACRSHVALSAPQPSAPVAERVQAYDQLPVGSYRSVDYLQLANGARVYYPDDLLPIVPPDSPTAKAVDASVSKRHTATGLGYGAIGAFVGGAALAIIPFAASHGETKSTLLPGIGIALIGGIGLSIAAKVVGASAEDEAATAFETYHDSLVRRLNLCVRADQIGECSR
jgi:hypothetical protein